MQEYAHPDFKEKVNEDKLRISNDLGKKWRERFRVSKNDHMKFMINMMKDKSKYLKKLEQRFRSQFVKDYPKMFYAYEVENIIIEQYYNCVSHCMTKLNIAEHLREDFHAIGLTSLRSGVWNFRTHKVKASLFTYCFNGVFNRILGLRTKHAKALNRANRAKIHLETDYYKAAKDTLRLSQACVVHVDYDKAIEEKESADLFKLLLEKTELKEDELFLLNKYITRNDGNQNWCSVYRDKFTHADGKKLSRQGVHVKLAIIKKKLWQTYAKLKNLPYYDKRNKFAV